jgi:hypothetical protein
MDRELIADVVLSPAVALLVDLHREGFTVDLIEDEVLTIAPRSRLTPDRMQVIVTHKDALKTLLRGDDAEVAARRDAFVEQLARTPAPRVPAFLFNHDIVYATGTCFSCGDSLPQPVFGRCWRCSVAWRLACKLPIPADLSAALDSAKVIT